MQLIKLVLILGALFAMSEAQAHKKHHDDGQADSQADTAPVSQQEKEQPTMYGKKANQNSNGSKSAGYEVTVWTDPSTGLTWMVCPLGLHVVLEQNPYYANVKDRNCVKHVDDAELSFDEAIQAVKAFNERNQKPHGDWRIPTREEFDSVHNRCMVLETANKAGSKCQRDGEYNSELDPIDFRNTWTSTLSAESPGQVVYNTDTFGYESSRHDGKSDEQQMYGEPHNAKNMLILVSGTSSLKATTDPDALFAKVSNDLNAHDKKVQDDLADAEAKAAAYEKQQEIDRAKAASDQAAANAVYNAKIAEARKHIKRGDTVVYMGEMALGNYTALVLDVEQDFGLVQIQTRSGEVLYVRLDQITPYLK